MTIDNQQKSSEYETPTFILKRLDIQGKSPISCDKGNFNNRCELIRSQSMERLAHIYAKPNIGSARKNPFRESTFEEELENFLGATSSHLKLRNQSNKILNALER